MEKPLSLPVLPLREEYGFKRTVCSCQRCTEPCTFTPGPLSLGDVARIAAYLGYSDLETFARENLVASPGATLARLSDTGMIITYKVNTLVPARQANGHCKFLQDGKCAIHPVSPFGCAMFDSHMNRAEGNKRSLAMHGDLYNDQLAIGFYRRLWLMLKSEGKIGPDAAKLMSEWRKPLRHTAHTAPKDRNKGKKR